MNGVAFLRFALDASVGFGLGLASATLVGWQVAIRERARSMAAMQDALKEQREIYRISLSHQGRHLIHIDADGVAIVGMGETKESILQERGRN